MRSVTDLFYILPDVLSLRHGSEMRDMFNGSRKAPPVVCPKGRRRRHGRLWNVSVTWGRAEWRRYSTVNISLCAPWRQSSSTHT